MDDVIDRLETVTRDFPLALLYGTRSLAPLLTPACGVKTVIEADLAAGRAGAAGARVVFDEDQSPLAPGSFDLIISLLTLHAVNDPVGALSQMQRALRPDGLLIAVAFGENTLASLRDALFAAESETSAGAFTRVAPFASVRDWGAALQRAGFALPVVDLDRVRVQYQSAARLFGDLRGMGETACLSARARPLKKATAAALFERLGPSPEVGFDLVTMTAWAPHESQPKPLKPGSAAQSLAEAVRRADPKAN